ncbi:MAG: hypothetical protein F6K58_18100 [Symploca sp. SIO2E9]|nr:hypothetical protein [Symploca sp. SIO2E9]
MKASLLSLKAIIFSLICLVAIAFVTFAAPAGDAFAAPKPSAPTEDVSIPEPTCIQPFTGEEGNPVFCFADPCSVTQNCVAGSKCVSNFCGGCNALFFRGADFVTNCDSCSSCTNPNNGTMDTLVNCLVAPCDTATCPANPKAKCFNNYCGGCNAIFFTDNGERVDCSPTS